MSENDDNPVHDYSGVENNRYASEEEEGEYEENSTTIVNEEQDDSEHQSAQADEENEEFNGSISNEDGEDHDEYYQNEGDDAIIEHDEEEYEENDPEFDASKVATNEDEVFGDDTHDDYNPDSQEDTENQYSESRYEVDGFAEEDGYQQSNVYEENENTEKNEEANRYNVEDENSTSQQANFDDVFHSQQDDEQYHDSKPASLPKVWPANPTEVLPPKSRILEIEVYYGEGVGTNFVTLEILEPIYRKPFLGGYRHRKTGLEYHHASVQTEYMSAKKRQQLLTGGDIDSDNVPKFHRETQTVKTKTRSQQTLREQGTQMAKPGVIIDTSNDRVYVPSAVHFTSEQLLELRTECTIKIQAFVRGWRARRLARALKQAKIDEEENQKNEIVRKQQEQAEHKRIELQRRMNPRRKQDFELLYNELEQWRQQEIERIDRVETDPEGRRLAMNELLRKETTLLQTIDRLKQSAAKANRTERTNKKLEYLAKPKTIENFDGKKTYVETPFTVRAKELMELYQGLVTPMLNIDERLDVLLHVKWTVKEFDCLLTRDIVDLIDREADLLNRGRKGSSLDGLRKRLSNLFLQFIETPEFNPLSAKLNHSTTKFANTQPLNA